MATKAAILLDDIRKVVDQLVCQFRLQRVILFGSQARGEARDESDVDLLVVMERDESEPRQVSAHRLREAVRAPKGERMGKEREVWLDFHVFSPTEFEGALKRRSVFVTTAVLEGIVLYEAPDAPPLSALLEQPCEGEIGMKPETQEWVAKAEDDLSVAERAMQPPNPIYDAACFHAQQSAEKYLKAFLEQQGILFPRTHDLVQLVELAGESLAELTPLKEALAKLTRYAVEVRYIGVRATEAMAKEALQIAEQVRTIVRAKLGLD